MVRVPTVSFAMSPERASYVFLLALLAGPARLASVPDLSSPEPEASADLPEPVKVRDTEPNELDSKVTYDGAQLWQVAVEQPLQISVVSKLSNKRVISVWGGNHSHVDVLVKADMLGNISRIFNGANVPFNVVINDLQKNIDEENPVLEEDVNDLQDRQARAFNFWRYGPKSKHMLNMYKKDRRAIMLGAYMGYNTIDDMKYWPYASWGHRMTWAQYHRLSDIHDFLDSLARTYPAICSVQTIGKSFEGRDLKVLRISNGNRSNKAIWIDGGIHAREWISPATVTYIINQFGENFELESEEIKSIDWYFLPVFNPDGYEYSHNVDRLWRKNRSTRGSPVCPGTDLNRNFGYHWGGKGTSNYPCSEVYCGVGSFSEPETKAVSEFILNSGSKFHAYISYHSYGEYILYPWGYDTAMPPDHQDLKEVGNQIASGIQSAGGSRYKVGTSSILLYPAAGGSDDWAKAVADIKYAYTIELGDTGRYGFVLPAHFIEPTAKESLAGLRELAKIINARH